MSATNARLKAAEELLGSHGWPQASGNQTVVEIYLAALQQETPSRSSLIRVGFDPEHVDYALLLLHNRGALNASNVEAIEVFAPDQALNTYATELETFARTARAAIEPLSQLYRQLHRPTQGRAPGEAVVRVIESHEDAVGARAREASRARRTMLRLLARNPINDRIILGEHPEIDLITEGEQVPGRRLVVDASILELEGALARLVALDKSGCEVRLQPALAATFVVYDSDVAIMDILNVDPTSFGCILFTNKAIITVVEHTVELLWGVASSLPGQRRSRLLGYDAKDLQILSLLAHGASDAATARQLRISQRTVERRLRAMMDAAGAKSRFQLGIAAMRDGLIDG